jgi:hypothetical protein
LTSRRVQVVLFRKIIARFDNRAMKPMCVNIIGFARVRTQGDR